MDKEYFKRKFRKIYAWLNWREHHKYNFKRRHRYIADILLGSLISIVAFIVIYTNIEKLNEIKLWIIKFGSVLLLVSLFYSIKYGWKVIKEIYNYFRRERNWVRYLIIMGILFLLWNSYVNRDTILNPVFEFNDKIDYSILMPLSLNNLNLDTETNTEKKSDGGILQGIKDTFKPEDRDVKSIEQEILVLVNKERANYNARALSSRSNLDNFARSWSDKMMSEGFFEHSNLNIPYSSTAGENIGETPIHYDVVGCGSTYTNKAIAECFVSGWISSPGHHENMIEKSFSLTGIGVSCDSSKCRATQVFSG